MTYHSMRLMRQPRNAAVFNLQNVKLKDEIVFCLDKHARDCPPHELARWAASRGLRCHWIDGAWVQVEVSPEDAEVLFGLLGEKLPDTSKLDRLLVESEEF